MNVFSVIPPPWGTVLKIAGPLVLAVGLYGTGFIQGSHHQKVVTEVKTVEHIKTQYKYILQTQPGIDKIIYRNKSTHDEAVLQIPTTVLLDPGCRFDVATIGLLNSVRQLPTEPE